MKKKKLHLDCKIERSKLKYDVSPFRLIIDGDVFYCNSYHHAVCKLLEILTRDEL